VGGGVAGKSVRCYVYTLMEVPLRRPVPRIWGRWTSLAVETLESLCITTGNREHGGRARFWESMETWRDHKKESTGNFGHHSAIAPGYSPLSGEPFLGMALVTRKVWHF
jgi:hypothetical protein